MTRAPKAHSPIARAWCSGAIAIILLATLSPQVGSANLRQGFFAPLTPGAIGASLDLAQNVLLYMPLGLVLALLGVSGVGATIAAAGLSLAIELCQFMVPGRDPVATDIVVNTVGASIAWLIGSTRLGEMARGFLVRVEERLAYAVRPSAQTAASLSFFWALAVSLVMAATCALLSVSLPAPYYLLVSSPFMDDVAGPVRIGTDGYALGAFAGVIDDVRIYSGARSPDAIRSDMQRGVSAASMDRDLVLAYGFDSQSREVTADATGRGHDALVRGATWTPDGRFGGAFTFDGRRSEILVPGFQELHVTRAITIEAWVKPAGRQAGIAAVVSHTAGTYFLRASSEVGALSPAGGGRFGENPLEARLRGSVPANEWTHLAVSYDGQMIALYVNGELAVHRRHWSTHRPMAASLEDIELAPGFVLSPSRVRGILTGDFRLNLRLRCGAPQTEPGQVFSIIGIQSTEVLVLEAAGDELRIRSASNAQRFGLAPADHRMPDALSGCREGNTIDLVVKGPLERPRLEDREGNVFRNVAPGIGSAWAFLFDSRLLPARAVAMVSWIFLAVLTVPFGFWARAGTKTVAGALVLIGTVILVPDAWGTRPLDAYQSMGLVTGMLAGMLLRTAPDQNRLDRLEQNKHVKRD